MSPPTTLFEGIRWNLPPLKQIHIKSKNANFFPIISINTILCLTQKHD